MELIIEGHLITAPITEILSQLKRELKNGKLRDIVDKGENVLVSCPVHKGGRENHASCGIYASREGEVEYGSFHCFTCGERGPLYRFVALCFDESESFGKEWLLERFGNTLFQSNYGFESEIKLEKPSAEYLSEEVFSGMENYHPYLAKRGIWEDTCQRFKIKYDPKTSCVVFPVYDRYNNLRYLTRRRIYSKEFINDAGSSKADIFLLNNVLNENSKICGIAESQFNALSAYQWGLPCVALLGAGTTKEQMAVLNSTPIRTYVLLYDNDRAGRHGASRFKQMIRPDVFVIDVLLPEGKDVNDLTQKEFYDLLDSYGLGYTDSMVDKKGK